MKNEFHVDATAIVGIVVMGVIGALAVLHGGAEGMTVAAGVAGGIAGWLAKGSSKTANVTADNATIQPDAGASPP